MEKHHNTALFEKLQLLLRYYWTWKRSLTVKTQLSLENPDPDLHVSAASDCTLPAAAPSATASMLRTFASGTSGNIETVWSLKAWLPLSPCSGNQSINCTLHARKLQSILITPAFSSYKSCQDTIRKEFWISFSFNKGYLYFGYILMYHLQQQDIITS
jgi:hypothetical protein